ncbi:MAG: MNIO family bufferin maturase [Thiotrichales bacterium]
MIPSQPVPADAGIGLRSQHYRELLQNRPAIAWLEAHSENYFSEGGQPLLVLETLRESYPLSLHGVGLGLGSIDPLNVAHLKKLRALIDRFEPALVSEHLCWNAFQGRYFNDLLPLPYTEEALAHVVDRIHQVQELLGRQILIENLSSYLEFSTSDIPEWEFIASVAQQSGCGILLDLNNIYVNACNHAFDAEDYLAAIPAESVGEFHLAGFEPRENILIDTHSRPVSEPVWSLFESALKRFGARPTLIEWDNDIPELVVLLGEAAKARQYLDSYSTIDGVDHAALSA